MSAATPAQPFDAGSTIGNAWEIYKNNAGILIPAALGLYAIQLVLALLFLGSGIALLVLSIVGLILGSLFQGFVIELTRDAADGKVDSTIGELVSSVTPVLLPLIGTAILMGIGIGIGFVLFIIPGLFLMTIWFVTIPALVLERRGVFPSFGRSRELVKGYGWSVFGVIVFVFVLSIAASIVAGLIGAPLGDAGEADRKSVV